MRHELHETFAIAIGAEQRLDRASDRVATGLALGRRVDPERDADVIVEAGKRETDDLRRMTDALVEQRDHQIGPATRRRRKRQLKHLQMQNGERAFFFSWDLNDDDATQN